MTAKVEKLRFRFKLKVKLYNFTPFPHSFSTLNFKWKYTVSRVLAHVYLQERVVGLVVTVDLTLKLLCSWAGLLLDG